MEKLTSLHMVPISSDPKPRFWNASWITGDQIYLLRVTPSVGNINDMSKYEFFAGYNEKGEAVWTNDFEKIKPLLEWNNNMGCVTVTYNAPLKKYLNVCNRWRKYLCEDEYVYP